MPRFLFRVLLSRPPLVLEVILTTKKLVSRPSTVALSTLKNSTTDLLVKSTRKPGLDGSLMPPPQVFTEDSRMSQYVKTIRDLCNPGGVPFDPVHPCGYHHFDPVQSGSWLFWSWGSGGALRRSVHPIVVTSIAESGSEHQRCVSSFE